MSVSLMLKVQLGILNCEATNIHKCPSLCLLGYGEMQFSRALILISSVQILLIFYSINILYVGLS